MSIWKITDNGPDRIDTIDLDKEGVLENQLEDWILADPSLLGEPLLIIGRQVVIPDVKDRIDLLALDPQGNVVVVELKRGELSDPVDMQALRYVSYISRWNYEDFENHARRNLSNGEDTDFNFNQVFQDFCEDAGTDDVPDLNIDQRIILVGTEIRDKLGSVALWLREHNIDIKVVEVQAYKEGKTILIEPHTIIPLPDIKFRRTGRASAPVSQPWRTDGRNWHLDRQCSKNTRDVLLKLDDLVQEHFDVETSWNQKLYVAYRVRNYNWIRIGTRANLLWLDISAKNGTFDQQELAHELGVQEFDRKKSPSGKLGLPSSVVVQKISEKREKVTVRIKKGFDLGNPGFMAFLRRAYDFFRT